MSGYGLESVCFKGIDGIEMRITAQPGQLPLGQLPGGGERPVARIQAKSGLSEEDLRICLTLIADKGVLQRVGTAKSTALIRFVIGGTR